MKRTLYLLVAVTLLAGLYFLFGSQEKDSSAALLSDFSVSDLSEVQRIVIASEQYRDIELSRRGEHWYLQDGHRARKNAMKNLTEVLTGLKIKYLPPAAAYQNIAKELDEIAVEVKIYGAEDALLQSYLIGGSVADERGTYMKHADGDRLYVMHLPTLEGSVRGRYIHSYDDWRDRTIIDVSYEDITSVEVNYPRQSVESYTITKTGVTNAVGRTVKPSPKIEAYLKGFEGIAAEAFENSNANQDSIRQLLPFCELKIRMQDDQEKIIKLYPVENYVDQALVTLENTPRISRYFADTSWGDLMLVQQRIIGKLLRGYSYFAENE